MEQSIKPWFLYLLECEGRRIYTGITTNVEARLANHQNGTGAKFTRAYPPVRLLAVQSFPDRSAASSAEWHMKQKTAQEKWAWVDTINC